MTLVGSQSLLRAGEAARKRPTGDNELRAVDAAAVELVSGDPGVTVQLRDGLPAGCVDVGGPLIGPGVHGVLDPGAGPRGQTSQGLGTNPIARCAVSPIVLSTMPQR